MTKKEIDKMIIKKYDEIKSTIKRFYEVSNEGDIFTFCGFANGYLNSIQKLTTEINLLKKLNYEITFKKRGAK